MWIPTNDRHPNFIQYYITHDISTWCYGALSCCCYLYAQWLFHGRCVNCITSSHVLLIWSTRTFTHSQWNARCNSISPVVCTWVWGLQDTICLHVMRVYVPQGQVCYLHSFVIPKGYRQGCTLIARLIGPTWGLSGADRTQVGPMLVPWTLLSGYVFSLNLFRQMIIMYSNSILAT